jgi:hypothetical protein
MKKMIPITILVLNITACGQFTDDRASNFSRSSASREGRLICSATTDTGASVVGCTDGNVLTASKGALRLDVFKQKTLLDIKIMSDTPWSGTLTLRYPPGGTGTRARVFAHPPGYRIIACDLDTLLSCGR